MTNAVRAGDSVAAAYRPTPDVFDEHVDASGTIRSAWSDAIATVNAFGPDGLHHRRRTAERLITDTGSAHTVGYDAVGRSRVDLLPLVFDESDWATLRAGIGQRARLHNALLADLYGSRTLIADGTIPAEAALGSWAYEPVAHGWDPKGPRLSRYSAEIVRDRNGQFIVLNEHTDTAAGAGRALLGRSILARSVPEFYRRDVESLVGFFDTFRATVTSLAPSGTGPARVVLLAPPSLDPTYVEHAFLAAQLGYNLVTASDLTVRQGRLWLRAIGGLEPIAVVIRAVDIGDSDALEISRFGTGVAGLVQVAREGGVGLSNTVGSALAGSSALSPFLAAVCRRLLGEELLLNNVPSLWCADPDAAAEVRACPDDYELVESIGSPTLASGSTMSGHEVLRRFELRPDRFVARRRPAPGSVPVVGSDGRIVAGWATLAMHAAFDGNTVTVLPGGTATSAAIGIAPMSKDVIVPAGPRRRRREIAIAPIDLRSSLPSRAAEALFWTGRNAERAEFTSRAVLTVQNALANDPTLTDLSNGEWVRRVVRLLGSASRSDKASELFDTDVQAAVADAMSSRAGATIDSLTHLLRGVATVREYLSTTTLRVFAALDVERLELVAGGGAIPPADSVDHILVSLAAFAGLTQESVVRGPGWQFLDLGRRWERAYLLAAGLDAVLGGLPDASLVGPLGEVALATNESLIAYRRRYRTDIDPVPLFELLIADPANPRSLRFQLNRLKADLADLPEHDGLGRCLDLVERLDAAIALPVSLI
jgi:uncharacterized circularly permuted ATP-grasp superfamily protein/uncharacterized alpha-E superfamily protein